jgi:hypothetical protein
MSITTRSPIRCISVLSCFDVSTITDSIARKAVWPNIQQIATSSSILVEMGHYLQNIEDRAEACIFRDCKALRSSAKLHEGHKASLPHENYKCSYIIFSSPSLFNFGQGISTCITKVLLLSLLLLCLIYQYHSHMGPCRDNSLNCGSVLQA